MNTTKQVRKVSQLTKQIETLVEDIYGLFNTDFIPAGEALSRFGERLAKGISERVGERRADNRLRLSNVGNPCKRKLWYRLHATEDSTPLPPATRFKFLYGDILEELVLFLAEEAGHRVEGRQDEIVLNGIPGHRDAVIDGVLVDVKSASSRSFDHFKNHLSRGDDHFGYLPQLGNYLEGCRDDGVVSDRSRAAFLVIDKTLGHLCLDFHTKEELYDYKDIEKTKSLMEESTPPPRPYPDIPDGKSGNKKLGVACSYCEFKHKCWPGLRTFLYSTGPRYLTQVQREPEVYESKT